MSGSRGVGAALLALPGFAGGPASWHLALEAARVSGFVPYLPGHGGTALAPGADFEEIVDVVAGLVRAQSAGRLRLAGYSMGARLALGLLVRHPELCEEALLVGVNPGIDSGEKPARRAWEEDWAKQLRKAGLQSFYAAWDRQESLAPARPLEPAAREARAASRREHDAEGLARALVQLGLGAMPDFRPRLGGIRQPVTLVVGASDAKFLALSREMVSSMARARLVVVPEAGHNVILEQPGALAEALGAEHES